MADNLKEILENGLSDFRLCSFEWSENEDDICIQFKEKFKNKTNYVTLLFVWVSNLTVEIEFGDYVGAPLLFESMFKELQKHRWSVILNFGAAPEGSISFECNDIKLVNQ